MPIFENITYSFHIAKDRQFDQLQFKTFLHCKNV